MGLGGDFPAARERTTLPPMTAEASVLPKLWTTIPEAIRNRLGREAGPQRAMLEEDHLLLILHQIPASK
ncbi:MAG: hypothetical protein RIS76_4197 [Verrucomicrobiota bacterium]